MFDKIEYCGVPIIANVMLLDFLNTRPHGERKWMRKRCYHTRIDKKWRKRFGTYSVPSRKILMFNDPMSGRQMIACHPDMLSEIKAAIDKQKAPLF